MIKKNRKVINLIVLLLMFFCNIQNALGEKEVYVTKKTKPNEADFDKDWLWVKQYVDEKSDYNVLDCWHNGDEICEWEDGTGPNGGGEIYSGPPPIPLQAEIIDDGGNLINVNLQSINETILYRINSGDDSGIIQVEDNVQFIFEYTNTLNDDNGYQMLLKVTVLTGTDMIDV